LEVHHAYGLIRAADNCNLRGSHIVVPIVLLEWQLDKSVGGGTDTEHYGREAK
jgi:hypothetical protein